MTFFSDKGYRRLHALATDNGLAITREAVSIWQDSSVPRNRGTRKRSTEDRPSKFIFLTLTFRDVPFLSFKRLFK